MTVDRDGDVSREERGSSISLRDVLTVLFKRWKLIVLFAVLVPAAALIVSVLRPPSYEVTAKLLVSKARAEVPLTPTESSQAVIGNVDEKELNSEVEILRSRKLIEEVLQRVGADDPKAAEDGGPSGVPSRAKSTVRAALGRPRLSPFEQMVVDVGKRLKVSRITGSTVIMINFRSSDPDWATRVVQTLTELYIERRVERYQSSEVVAFFERQTQHAEARLKESGRALEQWSDNARVTITKGPDDTGSLTAQKELVLGRLARSQGDLGAVEADVQEQTNRIAQLEVRLSEEPKRLESPDRNLQDPVKEVIEAELVTLELERDALLQDFKPDSRYVRDIESQIELARNRLEELQTGSGEIDGTTINPIHQNLKENLLRAEADLEGSRARHDALTKQVSDYRSELEDLNQKEFELESLRREAKAGEEEYLLYRKKLEEARISAAMDQQKLINVTIAQPAQRPLQPAGRGIRAVVFLGLLVGVAGGLGTAFGTEFYLDRSFTTGYEIERRLGIPHIASIPDVSRR